MSEALRDALEYYKRQISLAEDRIQLFKNNVMSVKDLGPPVRDTTAQAIEVEKRLIENYRSGVRIIEDLFARDQASG
ncbi:hypothetical protein M2226_003642 [Bradyrhizobium elkanii]|uniref:hypothetical protein n=1 Tax=Bradyrhizobium elkanii TaxID=29448 RepID=UPI002226DDD7|nr:hypothetical protein [Bradyrhizobium elkanii]MCW2124898.1 hypothetical protein [Bradyrhizobium elkanii]MCW2171644.1 hypothetical protein [Bradyrhizobium elkanii]